MKKLILFILIILLINKLLYSQDCELVRKIINKLASPEMFGRGYTNNGDKLAASFIRLQFDSLGLPPLTENYYQHFSFPINNFDGEISVTIDGKKLVPGYDYMVAGFSPSTKGSFPLVLLDKKTITNPNKLFKFSKQDKKDVFVAYSRNDFAGIKDKKQKALADSLRKIIVNSVKGVVILKDEKVSWSASGSKKVGTHPEIEIEKSKFPAKAQTISLQIENHYVENYISQNVLAYLPGTVQPDTFIVFCAHYDHLGQMGQKVYFPGANDNASGTAMVIDLARYFSQPWNRPAYSLAFMAFSGEEAGLLGSKFYCENPIFPLKNIKLVVNLDMVGTGSEGIGVANGKVYSLVWEKLNALNKEKNYLNAVFQRGESQGSDHYYFHKNNIPSIFIYTQGKEFTEYHNLYDVPDKLPLTEYADLFRLLTTYITSL
ncbi:MAG: M28 family peptidase [Lentimicrobiaceae bacterium]|nr:M28 family peptidase [Lentimicrobiaceae bacterium]